MDDRREALPDVDAPPAQTDDRTGENHDMDHDEDEGQNDFPNGKISSIDPIHLPGLDDSSLPTDSLPEFEYGPQLPDGHIRVLVLAPPAEEDAPGELNWVLVCDKLSNMHGKYCAVSYTWGNPAMTHRIRCNGKSLAVTENVHDAMKNLIGLFAGNSIVEGLPVLWIDAVCINQGNFAEREEQVKMMRDIYKAAKTTFVWLPVGRGASDEDLEKIGKGFTSMAMLREMYHVQQFRDMVHNGKVSFDTLDHMKYGEKELRVPWENRDGITKLFTQPWFERIWICQEIAVSENAHVFDGTHIAPWGLFADSAEVVHSLGGLENSKIWESNEVAHDKTFVGNVRRLEKLRKSVKQETQTGLLELLNATVNFQSTESLDRVYGLLGLITEDRDRAIVTSFLDYTISPYLLYLNITVNHILQHETLDMLHFIGPVKTDPAGKWLSIVPNLAATNNHKRGLGTFKSRDEWIYHASLDTKPDLKVNGEIPDPESIWGLNDDDEISLGGVILDTVTRVSKMLDSAGMSMATMVSWFETAMFAESSARFISGAMLKRHLDYLTVRSKKQKRLTAGSESEPAKKEGDNLADVASGETEKEKDEEKNIDQEILKLLDMHVKYNAEGNAILPGMENPTSSAEEAKPGSSSLSEQQSHSEEPSDDNGSPKSPRDGNEEDSKKAADSKAANNSATDNIATGSNSTVNTAMGNKTCDNDGTDNKPDENPPPNLLSTNPPSTSPPESSPAIGSNLYPLPPHQTYTHSFVRTLLHNVSPLSPATTPQPIPPDSSIFTKYYAAWSKLLQSHDGDSFNRTWLYEWYKEHAQHEDDKPVTTFAKWVEDGQLGRRMFRTEKGYIGTGVDGMEEGDLVVLLKGGQTGYIVRRVDGKGAEERGEEGLKEGGMEGQTEAVIEEEKARMEGGVKEGGIDGPGKNGSNRKYKFIGAAYVHGVMEGEGMELGKEETFVFV